MALKPQLALGRVAKTLGVERRLRGWSPATASDPKRTPLVLL